MADFDQPSGMVVDPRLAEIRGSARVAAASFAVEQIFGLYAGWRDFELTRWYGEYQQDVYKLNAKYAEIQAKDAIRRGELAAEARGREISAVVGRQRAAAAAQGIALDTGSQAELQAEALEVGMMDALEIENNAYREAMGYRIQATQQLVAGAARRLEAQQRAEATLTTRAVQTVGRVAARYYGSAGTGIVLPRGG